MFPSSVNEWSSVVLNLGHNVTPAEAAEGSGAQFGSKRSKLGVKCFLLAKIGMILNMARVAWMLNRIFQRESIHGPGAGQQHAAPGGHADLSAGGII